MGIRIALVSNMSAVSAKLFLYCSSIEGVLLWQL